jgi:hypothetical protein
MSGPLSVITQATPFGFLSVCQDRRRVSVMRACRATARAHLAHVALRAARRRVLPVHAASALRGAPLLSLSISRRTGGETGGTPACTDGSIWVRMGNANFEPPRGRDAANHVFCRGYAENKGDILAPQVGFEPTTLRLTASRLMLKNKGFMFAFSGFRLKSVPPIYPALLPFFIPPR